MSKNLLKNSTRALDIRANIATTAASRNPKNVMSTPPELITFYDTGKGLYLDKFVYFPLYKWNKDQIRAICANKKQRFGTEIRKKLSDVNSSNISISNIKR